MKILGISSGTLNGSNDSMCKEGLMGAQEAGAEIEFINLHKLDIKHCTGCIACVKSIMSGRGRTCALKDDFLWLLDKMLDADGILMVSPIFENGVPGIVHTVCDRFGPSMDRGNLVIADMLSKEHGGPGVDPRLLKDKVISFMAFSVITARRHRLSHFLRSLLRTLISHYQDRRPLSSYSF